MLNSLHKYEPRVHVMKISPGDGTQSMIFARSFPETRFIAVTAYQNEDVSSFLLSTLLERFWAHMTEISSFGSNNENFLWGATERNTR